MDDDFTFLRTDDKILLCCLFLKDDSKNTEKAGVKLIKDMTSIVKN